MGEPDPHRLAEQVGSRLLTEWMAFYAIEASDQDPELTEWDDAESAKRKAARKARARDRWRQN